MVQFQTGESSGASTMSMQDYLALLSRRRLPAAATLLAFVLAAVVFSVSRTPMYRAEAEVLLRTSSTDAVFETVTNSELNVVRLASAERDFAGTDAFRSAAATAAPPGSLVVVSVKVDPEASFATISSTLVFTAESLSPADAAAAAQVWADTYIDVRSTQTVSDFERLLEQITRDLALVEEELQMLLEPVVELDAAIATASGDELTSLIQAQSRAQASIRLDETRLRSSIDRLDRRRSSLLDGEFVLTSRTASARLSSAPEAPEDPFDPNWSLNLAIALLLGGVSAFFVPLLLESINGSVRSHADVEALGLRVLGSVPVHADTNSGGQPIVHTVDRKQSTGADAYRAIATAVQFLRRDADLAVLQVVSAEPGAGKTTTAVNLAGAFALAGSSTALVDADLRRPRVDQYFDVEKKPGLADFIGDSPPSQITLQTPQTDLYVIPSGSAASNPSELLGSQRFNDLLEQLTESLETIVVDCPPVLAAPDTRVIAHAVDGIVLVARTGSTKKAALAATVDQLRVTKVPILGVVLNRDRNFARATYGGYGYESTDAGSSSQA